MNYIRHIFYTALCFGMVAPHIVMALGDTSSNTINFKALSANTIEDLIISIINAILKLAIPVAGLFIVYSGFLFLTASGDATKLETAKKTFGWTIVGLAVVLGAKIITDIVAGTLGVPTS
ncbi:MAG: pilin [bacterium]|nr:pilin [bacterium]